MLSTSQGKESQHPRSRATVLHCSLPARTQCSLEPSQDPLSCVNWLPEMQYCVSSGSLLLNLSAI